MLNHFKALIRRYFGFSYKEINGFIFLSILFVLLLVAPAAINVLIPSEETNFTKSEPELDSLTTVLARLDTTEKENSEFRSAPDAELDKSEQKLFAFNPNDISIEEWQQLGVRKYLAERIIKYRSKGGKFRKKEDVKKIYGFPESLYTTLEPYITIPEVEPKDKFAYKKDSGKPTFEKPEHKFEKKQPARFDLNTADTTQLKMIKGIGTGFANKIIKYRELLGGYADTRQLSEVYGLSPETIEELLKYAVIQAPVRKINVNTATQDELYKHPYIKFRAKHIVAYRKQHGNFQSADDIAKIKTIEPETLQKILPYLEF
jgi:competence ComEA-like helix-hairpin-helix protein